MQCEPRILEPLIGLFTVPQYDSQMCLPSQYYLDYLILNSSCPCPHVIIPVRNIWYVKEWYEVLSL
jgi:hypothetical protein